MNMFKNFLLKQMMKKQLKGMPQAQQDMILKAVESNPELFENIGKEIKAKMDGGMNQMAATMQVMGKYKGDLQKIMGQ